MSKQRAHLVLARFLHRADQGVARVVEDDVQPAEVRVRLRHGLPDLRRIGHVERQRQDGVAETFLQVGDAGHVAGGGGHPVAAVAALASVQMRPKPREAPVMNQVFSMSVFLGCVLGFAANSTLVSDHLNHVKIKFERCQDQAGQTSQENHLPPR